MKADKMVNEPFTQHKKTHMINLSFFSNEINNEMNKQLNDVRAPPPHFLLSEIRLP